MGADFVLGISLSKVFPKPLDTRPGVLSTIFRSIEIMLEDVDNFNASSIEEKLMIHPDFTKIKSKVDDKEARKLIDLGYSLMIKEVDTLKEKLK